MLTHLFGRSRACHFTRCHAFSLALCIGVCWCLSIACAPVAAEESAKSSADAASRKQAGPSEKQAELDAAFIKMLSGSVLEGSFTKTGPGDDPTKLSQDKYTLGEVRKLPAGLWLIPARIQYGEHDVTLPVTVPIEWAGDTPVIVVDNLGLPGFGTVSARVMFFEDHYAGYWKHGNRGGHMFGVIRHADEDKDKKSTDRARSSASGSDVSAVEQEDEQRGQK